MRKYILGGLSIIILIVIWYIYSGQINNEFILPGPSKVFRRLFLLLSQLETYSIIFMTFFRLLIAFILSTILGIVFGLLSGNYQPIDEFLKPIISSLRTLPIASIIIIIMILIGRDKSLYVITFLMIFPIVYEATKAGVLNISQPLKDNIALESHPKLVLLFKIQLPLSFPYIRTSLFQSIGLGFKVIVMAEFITQSSSGIGRELYNGSISIQYENVFAWTLLLIIIVMIFEKILHQIKKAYEF